MARTLDPLGLPKETPEAMPATLRPPSGVPAEEARKQFWNLFAIMLVALFALATVGGWAYLQVRASLKEIRSAGLSSLLEAETKALLIWIDEKKRDAERWAATPEVQREAVAIASQAAQGASLAQLCTSPARQRLAAVIAPYATLEEYAAFELIAPDGTIISAQYGEYCGLKLADGDFVKRIAPAFAGRTVFTRPFAEPDRLGESRGLALPRALVWIATPVRDEAGNAIAALMFGRFAEDRFGGLLVLAASASSREAYAFDANGKMLTKSRYLGDLRAAGVLGEAETGVLKLAVRDPGGDLFAGFRPGTPMNDRALTRLAGEAIDALASGDRPQGTVLEPYRNYRGAEVIGAWRWLPEKQMAIAVEIEAVEAYAPLAYLQMAFGVLLGFVLVAFLAAAGTSLWAVRLRLREARRVGQYTLEREIGEGGLSRVFLARHSSMKRPTAVKVLKRHLASDEVVARFEREVQLCSRLSHPNTIEIYDYGRTRDGTFYYAMEYIAGITLEDLVRKDGALPAPRVVHILRQACGSLKEAHDQGLVHRDVKPHNLMLCRRGGEVDVVKVLDFGLVKDIHNPHTRDITQFARVLGTPLYMAPERIRDPGDADARSDIYALGAVAFFLLTGRNLFEAGTDHDLVHQVLQDTARSPTQAGAKDVPAALETLIARCLAKDRDARPASMGEVALALEELARQDPWRESQARAWWAERGAGLGILAPMAANPGQAPTQP